MNADLNTATRTKQMLSQLDLATSRLPIAQLLSELQTVVERLSFSNLSSHKQQSDPVFLAEVDLLFEGEISDELLSFIHWLAANSMIGILSGEFGQLFLSYCIKAYKQVTEVTFLTPVELSDELRSYTSNQLRQLYPAPARIVYAVNPSLAAGFVIQDGTKKIDRSLRSRMITAIKPRLEQQLQSGGSRG